MVRVGKFWWKCSVCSHDWQADINDRKRGRGCPACAGKVVNASNNLAAKSPELAKEYSSRNLLPTDKVVAGTGRKLWWKCSVCSYEWQASGSSRICGGTGCPKCAGNQKIIHPAG